jgi:hypothetical protein
VTCDILCRSKRIFGEELRQNVSQDCEISSSSVSLFAGCIAFPEVTQPSCHGRKKCSEISEIAPQMGVNCLAPLFLQPEKFDDKARLVSKGGPLKSLRPGRKSWGKSKILKNYAEIFVSGLPIYDLIIPRAIVIVQIYENYTKIVDKTIRSERPLKR